MVMPIQPDLPVPKADVPPPSPVEVTREPVEQQPLNMPTLPAQRDLTVTLTNAKNAITNANQAVMAVEDIPVETLQANALVYSPDTVLPPDLTVNAPVSSSPPVPSSVTPPVPPAASAPPSASPVNNTTPQPSPVNTPTVSTSPPTPLPVPSLTPAPSTLPAPSLPSPFFTPAPSTLPASTPTLLNTDVSATALLPPEPSPTTEPSELTKAYIMRGMVSEQMTDIGQPGGVTSFYHPYTDSVMATVLHEESPFTQVEYNQTWQLSAQALEDLLKQIDPSGSVTLSALRQYNPANPQEKQMLVYLRQLPIFKALAMLSENDRTLDLADIQVMMQRHMIVVSDAHLSVFIKD